jgi:hypothetical protein
MEKSVVEGKIADLDNLVKRKQFIVAEQRGRDLLKVLKPENPADYEYWVQTTILVADSLIKNVKNLKALEDLEKAHDLFPFEHRFLAQILELSIKLKRMPRAEAILKSLINISPDDLQLRLKMVNFYLDKDDNLSAIQELNNIISFEIYDVGIHRLLAICLGKEGLLVEQLNQVKFLQKLQPESALMVIEEANILIKLGQPVKAFELIDNLLNYKLDENQIDKEFVTSLANFSNLYIAYGFKDLLAELFIKTMVTNFQKVPNDIKISLEKFSKDMKWDLIFNFLGKNQMVIKFDQSNELDLIENVGLLLQYNKYIGDQKVSLKEYLNKVDLYKYLAKHFQPFVKSLVEVERQVA